MKLNHVKENRYINNRLFIIRNGIDASKYFAKQVKKVANSFRCLKLERCNVQNEIMWKKHSCLRMFWYFQKLCIFSHEADISILFFPFKVMPFSIK